MEPRSVLMLVADDLRPDLGAYGGPALTPNLDRLASSAGAVRFERAYVQQAICCPSRTSFLLGRRPDTTRVWDLTTQFRDTPGARTWKTLPQVFTERGYFTAGMGKVFHPLRWRGKSDDVAGGSWSEAYYQPVGGVDAPANLSTSPCDKALPVAEDAKYTDGMIALHAVKTLRRAAAQRPRPFFIAVGLHRPHLPWHAPRKYFELYPLDNVALAEHRMPPSEYNVTGALPYSWDPQSGPRHCEPLYSQTYPSASLGQYGLVDDVTARRFRRAYWATVTQTDHNMGLVLSELDALHLAHATVVVFLGDHGWQLGDLGEFGKKTNFERATRAPLIIRDPSRARPAAAAAALVEFVDIFPTVLELALGTAAPAVPICPPISSAVELCSEGRSLTDVMDDPVGVGASRHAAFMQYAACMHDEKVWHDACAADDEPRVMGYAMRTRRWRYVEWVRFNKSTTPPTPLWEERVGSELYDHTPEDSVDNSAEAHNRVADPQLSTVVGQLSAQLRAGWRPMRAGLASAGGV